MTLEEAIKHCLEVAEENDLAAGTYEILAENNHNAYERLTAETNSSRCAECAADHRQLAEWLTELKELRLQIEAPKLGSIEEYHYELAKCKAAFWSCNRRCMDAEEQYRRKADELRKAQEQIAEYKRLLKAVKWISIKDRLPATRKTVLIYDEYEGVSAGYYDSDYAKFRSIEDVYRSCNVTHWQPLPEPPKDGDPE